MTHELGYFRPSPHITRPRRLPPFLISLSLGAVLGLAGFLLLMGALAMVPIHTEPGDARAAVAETDEANFSTALDAFASDTGRYPSEAEGLTALASRPNGLPEWDGPYLEQIKSDPWGRPYTYHVRGPKGGAGYRIVSVGPDGLAGTSDDIDGGSDAAPGQDAGQ
jgi:general secretion pathway protein G